MHPRLLLALGLGVLVLANVEVTPADDTEPADLILHHAKVLTVDDAFSVKQAVAVKGDRILAVGSDEAALKHRGPNTKVIDAQGKTVLPGLYDSHTHPVGAASSELGEPLPYLQ